jgi:hypothetical protein
MKILILLSIAVGLGQTQVMAQVPDAAPSKATDKPTRTKPGNTVMDFEAEVIDGQKKAPELFLQLDSEKAELNTILYDRRNFNDFQPVNTMLRPLFSDGKKPAVGGQK